MPISYVLRENRLTPEPDDYMAMVTPSRSVEFDEVVDRMLDRGSTLTRTDIVGVLNNLQETVETLLIEGANVNLPLANFSSSIKGVFEGSSDSFDASRHQLTPRVTAGRVLWAAYRRGLPVQKQELARPLPNLLEYVDMNTGERNSLVTAGGMGQINGHRLRFDSTDAEQGIFFLGEDNRVARVTVVGQNKPSCLLFMLPPDLAAGEYALEVRAMLGNELRSGRLPETLTVPSGNS